MIEVVFAFIRQYWKPIAYITFLALIFSFGYYKGYLHEKVKFEKHLNDDARLMAIAKAENNRRVAEAGIITANVTKEYADAVAKINDYYKSHPHIVRLCSNTNSPNALPSESQNSSGVTTATNGVTEIATEIDLIKANKEIKQCQMLIELEGRLEEVQ